MSNSSGAGMPGVGEPYQASPFHGQAATQRVLHLEQRFSLDEWDTRSARKGVPHPRPKRPKRTAIKTREPIQCGTVLLYELAWVRHRGIQIEWRVKSAMLGPTKENGHRSAHFSFVSSGASSLDLLPTVPTTATLDRVASMPMFR